MAEVFKISIRLLIFSSLLSTIPVQGQLLKDTASLNLIKKGIDYIYDFKFENARDVSRKISLSFPEHPVIYLLNGMITYWENYPLIPSSPACKSYEDDMLACIRSCEKNNSTAYYAEYLLANLGARGMLLMYYADNNLSENVFPLAKSTYGYLRQSFNFSSVYPDFYFFTGLYNYYREAYPDAHPIYKILAFLFPKGDKEKGLKEMQTAAENSIMLKAESCSFLSLIYLNYENNYQQACEYSKYLHDLYPANKQYLAAYIKNLLLIKKYDEAEKLIRSALSVKGNSYFQAECTIFYGILMEKKYHDYLLAKEYYDKGIRDISAFGYYGNGCAAYGYFGLSRIYDINNDKRNKKAYRKMAMDLTNYGKVNFDD